jgi:hypothetical protein
MKAQFKYAFRTGLSLRGGGFAVIFVMNTVFIALGSTEVLPIPGRITAVSLGGVAIAVMLVFDAIGDVAIWNRMYAAPGAYLYALTPVPRWKTLLASVIVITVLDFVTMAAVIFMEVWLSLNLAGVVTGLDLVRIIWDFMRGNPEDMLRILVVCVFALAGYLMILMLILFCATVKRSVFYQKRVSWLLTALLAIATVYAVTLTPFLLAPFGTVSRWGFFFTVTVGDLGMFGDLLLTFAEVAGLFVLTSKLMERKLNI